jgi:hypothetical protein
MVSHPASGELCDWSEVEDQGWETLLLGNGMSINVSPYFAYERFTRRPAREASRKGWARGSARSSKLSTRRTSRWCSQSFATG